MFWKPAFDSVSVSFVSFGDHTWVKKKTPGLCATLCSQISEFTRWAIINHYLYQLIVLCLDFSDRRWKYWGENYISHFWYNLLYLQVPCHRVLELRQFRHLTLRWRKWTPQLLWHNITWFIYSLSPASMFWVEMISIWNFLPLTNVQRYDSFLDLLP